LPSKDLTKTKKQAISARFNQNKEKRRKLVSRSAHSGVPDDPPKSARVGARSQTQVLSTISRKKLSQVTCTQKTNILLTSLSIALLLVMVGLSNASGTPGVSVGNTATYGNVNFDWSSNDPSATPPAEWIGFNGTAWFSGTIENIAGTNVTISALLHYSNGTEDTELGWVDVDTGEGNMTLFLISANLNVGDPIYTTGDYSDLTINETIPMPYPGGSRQTNHVNVTMEESSELFNVSLSMNLYWDKATGTLTQVSIISNQTITYTTNYSVSMQLTDSNVWVVPEFGMPLIALLLSSAALVTLVATRKLRRTQIR